MLCIESCSFIHFYYFQAMCSVIASVSYSSVTELYTCSSIIFPRYRHEFGIHDIFWDFLITSNIFKTIFKSRFYVDSIHHFFVKCFKTTSIFVTWKDIEFTFCQKYVKAEETMLSAFRYCRRSSLQVAILARVCKELVSITLELL